MTQLQKLSHLAEKRVLFCPNCGLFWYYYSLKIKVVGEFSYFAVCQRFEATALPGWACWLECVSAQNNRCLSLWKHFCEYKTPTLHNIGTPWLEKNRRPAEGLFLTRSVWAWVCLCTDTFVCAFPKFLHRWPPPFGTFGTQNVTFTRASQLFKA